MKTGKKASNKRLGFALLIVFVLLVALLGRLIYWQIFKGNDLRLKALEQWSKSVDIKSDRGTIYDRTGKKLAVNMNGFSVWAYPGRIEDGHQTALALADVLDMDEEVVYEKITSKKNNEKLMQWVDRSKAEEIRALKLKGIQIEEENRRFYPNGNFASHILGFTDIDNNGLDGVEKTYDKHLSGKPGKWFKMTDAHNKQMPYDSEKIHQASDGASIVLTLDETIQYFAESVAEKTLIENEAKNVSIIVMEPKTGDILAMANKPDFDPNKPREPLTEEIKEQWAELSDEELQQKWYQQWRNFAVNDIYEPGSTFKLVTAAAALEEHTTTPTSPYRCTGYITDIPGETLRCARYYWPHGDITFKEGMDHSCNIVFVNAGRQLGKEKLLEYTKAFGFGEKTYIDLLGEELGLIPRSPEQIKPVNLATISYGQGIAVTPIQLITATSAIVNGGNLMKPRLVKEFINDSTGEIVKEIEPEVKRQVISKETSNTMLSLMETVVSEGSGSKAKIPGYRVGGKTGTAEKIIDGVYSKGKYVASFIGVAPVDDPQVVVLAIVDEPMLGKHYGGTSAAPAVKEVLEEIFLYLEIPPVGDNGVKTEGEPIDVPDVKGMSITEAGKRLTNAGFRYATEYLDINESTIVVEQYPEAWSTMPKGTIIDLTLQNNQADDSKVPFLTGKNKEEITEMLNNMGVSYSFEGEGETCIGQNPLPGEALSGNVHITITLGQNTE